MNGSIDPNTGRLKPDPEGNLKVPCGRCQECLKDRASEWALRCQHEMSLHDSNTFITLTYDDEKLQNLKLTTDLLTPDILTHHIQKFFKKLRKSLRNQVRYIYSVEYGSQKLRPHFHCIIFNHDFPDQKKIRTTKKGHPLFSSPALDKLWKYGYASIGQANVKTAYYIAAYSLKKHSGVNETTGEIFSDYMRCSKRPAIGLEYLKKHAKQLVQSETHLPRYYRKKLADINPTLLQEYENRLASKYKPRDDYQQYAKYQIADANPASSELRTQKLPDDYQEYLKNHLKAKSELQLKKGKK